MAALQRRRSLVTIRDDPSLARFVMEGKATGKRLGVGSYGSVEEVHVRVLNTQQQLKLSLAN